MARLELPIPPYRLYRYRSLTRSGDSIRQEIHSIKENYLWFSNYKAMNDPMEGFYRPSSHLRATDHYNTIYSAILDSKTDFGLISLTDLRDNVLMWAHYAGNYSGMCVRYKTDVLLAGLPEEVSLLRVAYTRGLPRLSKNDATDVNVAARKILSQKNADWTYEREWRLLGPEGKVQITRPSAVTRIYFGSRTNEQHVACIKEELIGLKIKFFRMNVNGYDHGWQEI